MSNMIERLARALSIADGMHPEAHSNDEDEVPTWTLYLPDARAAIEAMREPTDEMCEAAGWHQQSDVNRYQRAIEAALGKVSD